MSNLWVLVAESSKARIYSAAHANSSLELVESLEHEASRQHPRDLGTDVPGRVHDRFGPGRHSMDISQRVRAEEMHRFGREIAAHLEAAQRQKKFGKLVVMAGPAFLGVLRECFSKQLGSVIVGEVDKELVDHDVDSVRAHVPEGLAW